MRKLTTLALLLLLASCDGNPLGPSEGIRPSDPARIISDALHNGGNPFFFWLAPMVSQPNSAAFGSLDPAADPVVRIICEAASSASNCPGGELGSVVATFALGSGVSVGEDQYQLDFDTKQAYDGYSLLTSEPDQTPYTTYQVQVWMGDAPAALLGMASFQLGESGGDARNLSEPDQVIGLKDGRVLPVKFRVDLFAYAYATAGTDPCPAGCSVTRIDGAEGGTAYYTTEAGEKVTGVTFEPGDLEPLPEDQDYTLLISPLSTGSGESIATANEDLCAFDVALQKYDCFRYSIFPDVEQFNNPVRFGICKRSVPESAYQRLVKVDRGPSGEAIVTYPDPVSVEDFLPCETSGVEPAIDGTTALIGRVIRLAFDRLIPPLFAQTTIRTWGGMADDFSDLFWTIEQGLVSHWTADQLVSPYDDAMLYDGVPQNNGVPNAAASISTDGGVFGDAFGFAAPVFDPESGAQVTAGGFVVAPAHGIAGLQTLSLAGWVRLDEQAPLGVIQRFVTVQGEKAVLRMDGENEPGQLDFYATFEGAEAPIHVRYPGPLPRGCYLHVAGTYNGSQLQLYLNGVEVGTTSHAGALVAGTGVELSSASETLRGMLDEVRIYDAALNADQIATLFAFRPEAIEPCAPPPPVTVRVSGSDPEVAVGYTTTLTATAVQGGDALSAASFQWGSSNTTVAAVDENGVVMALAPGQATIEATTTVGDVSYAGTFAIDVYTPLGTWTPAGSLTTPRRDHVALYLEAGPEAGKILILGGTAPGAELYDPVTQTSAALSGGSAPVVSHGQGLTVTLLTDGTVLFAGGAGVEAQIFDPTAMTFAATQPMTTVRDYATATRMADGRVLFTGGNHSEVGGPVGTASAEIYDPDDGTFTATGSMAIDRTGHAAALLSDGRVLVAGGTHTTDPGFGIALSTAEVFDPATEAFSPTGDMSLPGDPGRFGAHKLAFGQVLMISGSFNGGTAEVYDANTGSFSQPDSFWTGRGAGAGIALSDGRILFAGGVSTSETATSRAEVELFDPGVGRFFVAASMAAERQQQAIVRIPDGAILVLGGSSFQTGGELASVERWQLP